MNVSKLRLLVCAALFVCHLSSFAAGNEVYYAGFESGELTIDTEDYQKADAASLLFGVAENQYIIQLNGYRFDDIELIDNEDVLRQLEGYSLQIGRDFRLLFLNLSISYGRLWWDVRDFENDEQIARQKGGDRLLEAQAYINFGPMRLYVTRKEFRQVAGEDIDVAMFGVRYTFR